jgi:hypothetical protein
VATEHKSLVWKGHYCAQTIKQLFRIPSEYSPTSSSK